MLEKIKRLIESNRDKDKNCLVIDKENYKKLRATVPARILGTSLLGRELDSALGFPIVVVDINEELITLGKNKKVGDCSE